MTLAPVSGARLNGAQLPAHDSRFAENDAICNFLCDHIQRLQQGAVDAETAALEAMLSNGDTLLHAQTKADSRGLLGGSITVKHFFANFSSVAHRLLGKPNSEGLTPLNLAAKLGERDLVAFYHEKGAEVDTSDNNGKTPAHHAADNNDRELLGLLFAIEGKLNAADHADRTPRYYLEHPHGEADRSPSSDRQETLATLRRLTDWRRFIDNDKRFNFWDAPAKGLVTEGGGVKGIVGVGSTDEFAAQGLLAHVKRVGGTSAGSIIATLLAVGYAPGEIKDILLEKPLTDHLEGFGKFVGEMARNPSLAEARRHKKKCLEAASNLAAGGGVCSGNMFQEWIEEKIRQKLEPFLGAERSKHATFGQLNEAIRQGAPLKHLKIVVGVMARDANGHPFLQPEFCSSENPKCAYLVMSDVLLCSMSLPGVFCAQQMCEKSQGEEVAERLPTEDSRYFSDPGVVYNYPVDMFDELHGTKTRTLGISLNPEPVAIPVTDRPSAPLMLETVSRAGHASEAAFRILRETDKGRTVYNPTAKLGTFDFHAPRSALLEGFLAGRASMAGFLQKQREESIMLQLLWQRALPQIALDYLWKRFYVETPLNSVGRPLTGNRPGWDIRAQRTRLTGSEPAVQAPAAGNAEQRVQRMRLAGSEPAAQAPAAGNAEQRVQNLMPDPSAAAENSTAVVSPEAERALAERRLVVFAKLEASSMEEFRLVADLFSDCASQAECVRQDLQQRMDENHQGVAEVRQANAWREQAYERDRATLAETDQLRARSIAVRDRNNQETRQIIALQEELIAVNQRNIGLMETLGTVRQVQQLVSNPVGAVAGMVAKRMFGQPNDSDSDEDDASETTVHTPLGRGRLPFEEVPSPPESPQNRSGRAALHPLPSGEPSAEGGNIPGARGSHRGSPLPEGGIPEARQRSRSHLFGGAALGGAALFLAGIARTCRRPPEAPQVEGQIPVLPPMEPPMEPETGRTPVKESDFLPIPETPRAQGRDDAALRRKRFAWMMLAGKVAILAGAVLVGETIRRSGHPFFGELPGRYPPVGGLFGAHSAPNMSGLLLPQISRPMLPSLPNLFPERPTLPSLPNLLPEREMSRTIGEIAHHLLLT